MTDRSTGEIQRSILEKLAKQDIAIVDQLVAIVERVETLEQRVRELESPFAEAAKGLAP